MPSRNNQSQATADRPEPRRGAGLRRGSGVSLSRLDPPPWFDPAHKAQFWASVSADPGTSHAQSVAPSLPAEIAFLIHYGVASDILMAAAVTARTQGVSADRVLLAEGKVSEYHFYRSLARYLRLAFIDAQVIPRPSVRYPRAIRLGLLALASKGPELLAAPRGSAIAELAKALRRNVSLCSRLALSTPTYLSGIVRGLAREEILRRASLGLWSRDAALCARNGASQRQKWSALAIGASLALSFLAAPMATSTICGLVLSLVFLAVIWLRLAACAASAEAKPPASRPLKEEELPVYSIVIALYREARVVAQLLAALDAIDYPRAKLDVKFVVEEDDEETLAALLRGGRHQGCEFIVAPVGLPRTKPRALNVALPLLRGPFVAIFDAEDVPDPQQIRMAAQRFASAPEALACLQARLAIDNTGDGWLARLFAIEYAVLFDTINVGLGALRLPFPLGGSSNHFRTDVLRKLGGWDAWNVTEDADIGLRLARFGYYAESLPSTTYEEAPAGLKDFLGQRRRWCKGWYQTFIVLCRTPLRLVSELGIGRAGAALLILISYALAPLAGPFWALWFAAKIGSGHLAAPSNVFDLCAATLWTSVFVAGIPAILWPALQGMKRRGLLGLWRSLFLLPLYSALICYAAWMSIYDLLKRPQHWYKTEHGLARSSRRAAVSRLLPLRATGAG